MKSISLTGPWRIESTDGRFRLQGLSPTSFFLELERSGYWGGHDVFYRENNRQCLELADRDIAFAAAFPLPAGWLEGGEGERVFLEADGLDTLATLTLNGQKIGRTENMHRRYRFDVTGAVVRGLNDLSILFDSSIRAARERQEKRAVWGVHHALDGSNHLRKSYCSFGWDWGPQIPDVGIWRDLRLACYRGARIADVHVTQEHCEGLVILTFAVALEAWSKAQRRIEVRITDPQGQTQRFEMDGTQPVRVCVDNPRLWWPVGYGAQDLYEIEVALIEDEEVLDLRAQSVGLRTLRLERAPDQWGESFGFVVNGKTLFARGANYIPEDVYLNRPSAEATERLLRDCLRANMNCLRVWGGGVYPDELFFDLCDRLGIVVWQDLMFACAMYDVNNPEFYREIEAEVRDNLLRLRHHACLGLICGNNENEVGLEHWGFPKTKMTRAEYLKQYEFLFPQIVAEVCPEIDYWPSSPSSGGAFEEPNDDNRGDVHYWGVWHSNLPASDYRKHPARFLSEFGLQSLPSRKTVASFTEPEDRNLTSAVMDDHQRCGTTGNGKILAYLADSFRLPRDFDSLIYLSQLVQADGMRIAVEFLRQNRGRCMGAFYWQLNDVWPGPTWSSLDVFLRWKALHYFARRFYDPVLLSCLESEVATQIYLTNDTAEPLEGKLTWALKTFDGQVLQHGSLAARVGPLCAQEILALDLSAELDGVLKRSRYLSLDYRDAHRQVERIAIACFAPSKYLALQDPGLALSIAESPVDWILTLTCRSFARYVELDLKTQDTVFSDNHFDLEPGQPRQVTFPRGALSREQLEHELTLRSLFDSY